MEKIFDECCQFNMTNGRVKLVCFAQIDRFQKFRWMDINTTFETVYRLG